jgi:putative ABC transport system permease protein
MRPLIFFLRVFNWFSLRQVRQHPWRAATVLAGVALGAAVFGSVRLAVHASLDSFGRSMDVVAGRADHTVTRPGGRVDEALVVRLLAHPAVHAASPFLSTYTRARDGSGRSFLLIGLDPILDRPLREWQVAHGSGEDANWVRLLSEPYTLIAGAALAASEGWTAGQTLALGHRQGTASFTMVGQLVPEGLATTEGGRIAITDIATFQEFTGTIGAVDRIDLVLHAAPTDATLASLTALLPKGTMLQGPGEAKRSGQGMIRAYALNLSILSFAALFVGMFLVYSLVALNAASRRRELAILRSIGASARTLFWLFIAEGAFFGLAGWLLALPISSFLTRFLLAGVSRTITTLFVRVNVTDVALSPEEIAFSLGVTLAVAVLAAVQPAWEAMRIAPKEVMAAASPVYRTGKGSRRLAAAGLFCVLAVVPLAGLPGYQGIPLPGYLATFLLFLGFALMAPWGLQCAGRQLRPMLRRRAGLPAHLAAGYIQDSGSRTAVSVGALMTAVALFTALVIMVQSFRHTVEIWVEQTISGDLFVTTRMAETNHVWEPLPDDVQAYLQGLTALDLAPDRRFNLSYDGFPFLLEAMDFQAFDRYGSFFWLEGEPRQLMGPLSAGEGVIVSEVFANRTGLSVGDRFQYQVRGVPLDWPILGIVRDYRTRGGVVFCSLADLQQRSGGMAWGGVRLFFKDRQAADGPALERLQEDLQLRFGDRLDMFAGRNLRASVLKIFDETFAITTVLLLIALVVAALGITTTLTVLVLERTRELNTVYAVGGSLGQIRGMILWEAVFMVTVGEIGGLLCGFILSYLLVFVINRQSFGWTFLYGVDWGALAFSLPLIVATALMAALPAMRVVYRVPPATLLRER